ncbi:unnamed protein product [Urochloa humidicola]
MSVGFLEYKVDHSEKKNLAIGQFISSEDFSAGGHRWRIQCYPRGDKHEQNGEYISIYLTLVSSKSENVKAVFDIFILDRDGVLDSTFSRRSTGVVSVHDAKLS